MSTKRLFDFIVSGVLLCMLFPLLLILSLLVAVFLGRPVLFRQQRPGLQGGIFTILKFRTMTDRRDAQGNLLPDAERLTPFGKFLRASSLDELPELWNVLRGEMSLVGPRPLLTQYLTRYSARQARRHEVRPGITGWAQINGRNATTWEDRLEQDVWYVENHNLWLDCKILFLTLTKVFRREGISHQGHATMPEFWGNESQAEHNSTNSSQSYS